MAERAKLNNIAKAKTQHGLDMEAMQRGAATSGTLVAPSAPTPKAPAKEPDWDMVDPSGARHLDDNAAKTGAANLEAAKTNPGTQEKLNMMAKARAKYLGEGI